MSKRSRNASRIKDGVYTTDSGLKVKLKPVPGMLLESAQSMIPVPEIPMFTDPNTGNLKENPESESYRHALQIHQEQRGTMAVLAALVKGVELIDDEGKPLDPPDDGWKEEIAFFGADWRNPTPQGYKSVSGAVSLPESWAEKASYLMYVVLSTEDLTTILGAIAGGEEYEAAVKSFQGN